MATIPLKYGCNPTQSTSFVEQPDSQPLKLVNGNPSYINVMDALRGWQLVRDLKQATGKAAAASFKHVSPAGAAVAAPLSPMFKMSQFIDQDMELSPVATAYAKARSSDRPASFGDFVCVSEPVDITLANLLKPEVSDGIIAPSFDADALEVLKAKKKGGYVMFTMDPTYEPPENESRTDYGITLTQDRNYFLPMPGLLDNIVNGGKMTKDETETAVVATTVLKHTQSNSIAVAYASHAIGIGAGQQSRIACTRIACDKADRWFLKMHPKAVNLAFNTGIKRPEKVNAAEAFVQWDELNDAERKQLDDMVQGEIDPITQQERADWLTAFKGVVMSSDAFIPFRDNVDRCAKSGVAVIVQAGGAVRDDDVTAAADEHNIVMVHTGIRWFLH